MFFLPSCSVYSPRSAHVLAFFVPAPLLSIRSAAFCSAFFGREEREWVKRGHHQEIKGADVTGVVFSPRGLSCNLYGSRRDEIHTPSLRSLLWQLQ